jgi:Kelch motif
MFIRSAFKIFACNPVRRLVNLGIHMQKHCLKNMLSFGVALIVLVGWSSIASAQWTPLANAFPSGFADTCVLLTDGTVMCHEYNAIRWHRLKPDINGNYQNGSWDVPGFTVADMPNGNDPSFGCVNCPYQPLYFASAVLPDGRVVVIGGEYNDLVPVWTDIGFMYDPVTNSWSAQISEPFGGGHVGDAQSTILTNGTMLLANISNRNIASFNPATLTFSALAPTDKDDINNEEGWNQLPNGGVLTVDSRIQTSFEIYDSATNSWGTAGSTVVNLADTGAGTANSKEVGPAVLRPDGTLIAFSGTNSGRNAFYNTATGTWAATGAAGDFPPGPGTSHYAVADGPACLLPNGNVLVMASPVFPNSVFNQPSHFFEFDGTNLTQVADSPNAASFISYQGRMLLLPSGEVLLTAYNQGGDQLMRPNARTKSPIKMPSVPHQDVADVVLYSNGGAPQDAWRPVITTAPSTVFPGNTYFISGTLFNGFSEGAFYGDDAQMSTNYPLVRITNHATGHVFYARTHNHSRMGVEVVGSSEIVTTQFDVPASVELGASDLVVVANGIPSLPANTVVGTPRTTPTPRPRPTPPPRP